MISRSRFLHFGGINWRRNLRVSEMLLCWDGFMVVVVEEDILMRKYDWIN